MKLERHEISTSLWTKLSTHYKERLETKRRRLESDGCTDIETTRLRESIKEIKAFLAMAEPGRETREPNAE